MLMCLVPQKGGNLSQGRKTEAQRFSVGEDLKASHLLLKMNEESSVQKKCTMIPIVWLHRKLVLQHASYNCNLMERCKHNNH